MKFFADKKKFWMTLHNYETKEIIKKVTVRHLNLCNLSDHTNFEKFSKEEVHTYVI